MALQSGAWVSAGVLYSDNFNRSSSIVGNTSTGNYAWTENENDSFACWVNGTQLILNGGGGEPAGKSGLAYVNYNLDAVSDYSVTFTFTVGVGAVTNTAWTLVTPRGNSNSATSSSGWLFRKTATNGVSISFWDAATTTETAIQTDVFTAATATSVIITVTGNSATLTIGSFTDTRVLNTTASDGNADYFGFSHQAYSRAYVDDLVVTAIPEASTLGIIGLAGMMRWIGRR